MFGHITFSYFGHESAFIFDRIFIKPTGNEDRHTIADSFYFPLDLTFNLEASPPWASETAYNLDVLQKSHKLNAC